MLRKFKKGGWSEDRVRGSHHVMKKRHYTAVIPMHGNKDLATGTEKSLLKIFEKEASDEDD